MMSDDKHNRSQTAPAADTPRPAGQPVTDQPVAGQPPVPDIPDAPPAPDGAFGAEPPPGAFGETVREDFAGKDFGDTDFGDTDFTSEAPDSAGPVATDPPGPADADRVAALEARIAELQDQLLRAVAETENVRRRGRREVGDASKFAITGFARALLGVADNLTRAIEAVPEDKAPPDTLLGNLRAGVVAVERELAAAFEKNGLVKLTPLHEPFDPNFHHAMFEIPDNGKPAGTIMQVLQPGFLLKDRLLRPAMVGVSRPDNEAEPAGKIDTTA